MDHNTTSAQPLHVTARGYAQAGWHVLPTRGKRPIVKDWEHQAESDWIVAGDMWNPHGGPWSSYNIAIACGPSGLVVLDVDHKDGRDGFETINKLHLPPTYSVRTPTGGLHLYFQAPTGVKISSGTNVLGDGIDVRAQGGLVVAAGSRLPNGVYEVTNNIDPVVLPDRLLARLSQRTDKLPSVIPKGSRDNALIRLAGAIARQTDDPDIIRATVEAANRNCQPPKTKSEIDRICASAARWEPVIVPDETGGMTEDHPKVKSSLERMEADRLAKKILRGREEAEIRQVLGGHLEPVSTAVFVNSRTNLTESRLWGDPGTDGAMAWLKGQSLMFIGPPGVGKSTVALQLLRRRTGDATGDLLGMNVVRDDRPCLVLAIDRAHQAALNISRMASDLPESGRLHWIDNLPPEVDIRAADTWVSWLKTGGYGTILIDSVMLLGFDLTDSADATAFGILVETTIRADIEVVSVHHTRKTARGDRKPAGDLDDSYGGRAITSGAGSVFILTGGDATGEPIRMVHRKSLTRPVPSMQLELNARTGAVTRVDDDEEQEQPAPEIDDSKLSSKIRQALIEIGPAMAGKIARHIGSVDPSSVRRSCRTMPDVRSLESGAWELIPEG